MNPTQSDYISLEIEKYADMVRRICFLHLRNDADVEDAFQEVFLKFFLNYRSFENEAHKKAWLCRVAFNQCKDLLRGFWRKKTVSIEDMQIPVEDPEQGNLLRAVLALPADQKNLVYMHYVEGLTVPEIARAMEKNENTVYSALRRAKTQLRKKVGDITL